MPADLLILSSVASASELLACVATAALIASRPSTNATRSPGRSAPTSLIIRPSVWASTSSWAAGAFFREQRMKGYHRTVLAFLRLCPQQATAGELRRAMDAYTGFGDYLGGGNPLPSPADGEG